MIWHRDINGLQPPYRIESYGTARLAAEVKDVIAATSRYLAEDRLEHLTGYGEDVDVSMHVMS